MIVSKRLTSLLYGGAAGVSVTLVGPIPPEAAAAGMMTAGLATEWIRGWRRIKDE